MLSVDVTRRRRMAKEKAKHPVNLDIVMIDSEESSTTLFYWVRRGVRFRDSERTELSLSN